MRVGGGRGRQRLRVASFGAAVLIGSGGMICGSQAEEFDGPSFKKGLWRFQRTVEVPLGGPNVRFLLQAEETLRCVDPTIAMRGTFASPDVGGCRSSKAERQANRYTFANRCDYLGPVRTDITVLNLEAYTEINETKAGAIRKVDTVIAQRIGDCDQGN